MTTSIGLSYRDKIQANSNTDLRCAAAAGTKPGRSSFRTIVPQRFPSDVAGQVPFHSFLNID